MKDIQESLKLPAVLFPNGRLPEPAVKKILSFFGPLKIFQPWHMDRAVLSSEKDSSPLVEVLHPPPDLKPTGDFSRILEDLRTWMDINPDKGYRGFLSAGGLDSGSEDTTWAIRKALRQGRDPKGEAKLPPVLKWHLVLHLAQQMEDDRGEAETMLGALREKHSPLKGTVEAEGPGNLFDDLPAFGKEPVMEENRLVQVYEAWFSLFGRLLREHELLITTNQQIMAHISGAWQEFGSGDEDIAEMGVAFRVPDLSPLSVEDLLKTKARAFDAPLLDEVSQAIMTVWEDPKNRMTWLKDRAEAIERAFPEGRGNGTLWITMVYLKPGVGHKIWGKFSGKTLTLVSQESRS
jgi:hypothetical protein